jgi:NADH dehydrogenase/putative oxidoreductase
VTTRDLAVWLERRAGPLLSLVLRLAVAQAFFVSGVVKAADWDKALYLARYEYPVAWLDAVHAAAAGLAVELAGSILLAIGLATRFAALALAALAGVVQASYVPTDGNLLAIAVLGWFAVHGAGTISLDAVLANGFTRAPVPFAAYAVAVGRRLTAEWAPWYLVGLRLVIVAPLLCGLGLLQVPADAGRLLPLGPLSATGDGLGSAVAATLAAAMALGVAPRAAAGALAVLAAPTAAWLGVLTLLVVHGPGRCAVGAALAERVLRARERAEVARAPNRRPHVVIVGAGFAGVSCALALRRSPVDVTIVDRRNHHVFQPLLYQVATAALSPADIATPIRALFRDDERLRVLCGEVTGVDAQQRAVQLGERRIPYDYLVIATGATHGYFGREGWRAHAPGLKCIEDALDVRRRLLSAFEAAEALDEPAARAAHLTFVVVGGGPTGVELAGAIAELARFGLAGEFRTIDPATARVILVQSGERILPAFAPSLSARATDALRALGVEVWTKRRVDAVDEDGVTIDGERMPSRCILWAAGVVASPAAHWLGIAGDGAGRIPTRPDLSVAGLSEVFAAGDTALALAWRGSAVPGLAPAAKQAGRHVARVIDARVRARRPPPPFVYRHVGSLATIGRRAAVAEFVRVRIAGALAWWLWGLVHLGFLIDARSRLSVAIDWLWSFLTYRSATRLITGP